MPLGIAVVHIARGELLLLFGLDVDSPDVAVAFAIPDAIEAIAEIANDALVRDTAIGHWRSVGFGITLGAEGDVEII